MTQYLFQTMDSYSDLDEAAQGPIDHQPGIRPASPTEILMNGLGNMVNGSLIHLNLD